MLCFLTRRQIDDVAWDDCVAGAHNALSYGHTWYLDAVTYLPDWTWEGLVLNDVPAGQAGSYKAVLPIPLRRRWGRWVVYQPFFCQFVALFSDQPIDPVPFLVAVYERYRHASKWQLLLNQPLTGLPGHIRQQVMYTHVLPLAGVSSDTLLSTHGSVTNPSQAYTADRRMNLRRAARRISSVPDWQVTQSTDIEPLLNLFRENHADQIGVAEWAYAVFRRLFLALGQRGLVTVHYAWANGQIVAGALFVEQHGRIIYLFNAANREGRRLNARAVLIDQLVRAKQQAVVDSPLVCPVLDFESPDKPGIVAFYESFGATAQPFVVLTWSRLTWAERLVRKGVQRLKSKVQSHPAI